MHSFRDRADAGAQLARQLAVYRGQDVLVLGIPRGGVPVAAEVARRLEADLDIVVARKLGAPFQPELALGAVTASGSCWLDSVLLDEIGISREWLEAIIAREIAEARRQEHRFRGTRPTPSMRGRRVIVVDDGLATGATMRAAVRALRQSAAAQLIVAVPVAPPETCAALRYEVDEVIALYEPEPFIAVGLYYRDFRPTDDRQIEELLGSAGAEGSGGGIQFL
jgi:putative phosphoribosyl transferase